jgi:hypothetical protein
MNFATHGLHSTCPQGIANTAFELFESDFRHAGQDGTGVLLAGEASSVNFMLVRVFRESGWVLASAEEGQSGFSFGIFGTSWMAVEAVLESGVCEGTQKEGRWVAEAFCCHSLALRS